MRRLSWAGLAMCVFYAGFIALCLIVAEQTSDGHLSTVWEVPVAFQAMLAEALGLDLLFAWLPKRVAYALLALQTFVVMYLCGWWLEEAFRGQPMAAKDSATRHRDGR